MYVITHCIIVSFYYSYYEIAHKVHVIVLLSLSFYIIFFCDSTLFKHCIFTVTYYLYFYYMCLFQLPHVRSLLPCDAFALYVRMILTTQTTPIISTLCVAFPIFVVSGDTDFKFGT